MAYLNWMVFDRDYSQDLGRSGYMRITTNAKETGTNATHDKLFSPEITITQPGYVYIWLSNENPTPVEVYFDDFKVTQTKSPVIASNDYYPFGLVAQSYQRENSVPNQYKYNGNELQDELSLGWYDYGARMYDPAIARWMAIDPLADKYYGISPYAYVANNPIKFIDPDGRKIIIFGERYGFLGLRRRRYEYHGNGEAPSGSSQFVQSSFKALNHERGGDSNGIIDALAESDDKNVYIKRTRRSNGFYNHNNNTIRWNPDLAAQMLDGDGGVQPPSMVLFHEVGHGYRHNFKTAEYFADLATKDSEYGNVEERKVIEQYETPAAHKLGYGKRTSHNATLYPVDGPLSTWSVGNLPSTKPKKDNPNFMDSPVFKYIGSAGPADGPRRMRNKPEEK
jgi:RHS repeat-associated protein